MKLLEVISKHKFKLVIDPELEFDEEKTHLLKEFIQFCVNELKINGDVTIKVVSNREQNDITTTAFYDDNLKLAAIWGKGRMLGDIMRSIGHELTHMKQYEDDKIHDTQESGKDGTDIENEANAKAGVFIRIFGRKHAEIFGE